MADNAVQQNKQRTSGQPMAKSKASAKTTKVVDAIVPKQLVIAHARNLRLSPRKLRLVTNLVRNMRVADALTQLQFTNKKGAQMLTKLLLSATANAEHNFSMNRENLFVKTITCDMGSVLQRSFPRARGSAFIIRRKLSHINVILEERAYKAKRSKALVPKPAKKDKPVITREGSAGVPEEVTSSLPKEKSVVETHHENDDTVVAAKKSPERQLK